MCGDVTTFALAEHAYDVWHDRAAFHFLTDPSHRAAYVRQVARAVKPGGYAGGTQATRSVACLRFAAYWNDFNTYNAGDWTVAPATGTSALTAGLGGQLTLTTGAVSGNGQGNALNPVSFAFTPGYQTWFSINFKWFPPC